MNSIKVYCLKKNVLRASYFCASSHWVKVQKIRRRALLSEITSLSSHDTIHQTSDTVIRDVVEQLGSARLVTFDRDPITRSPTIEVTHEAIIREWSLLRSWLDESRQDVRMQRALSSLASEWADNAQDASFVLRGARLEQFERWVEQTNLILTQQEADYLRTGIKRREQEFSDERERQEREAQFRASFCSAFAFTGSTVCYCYHWRCALVRLCL
jgi:hypothetical protein